MPAELDRNADGSACFFAVREPAWHREGVVLEAPPTLEEALRLGGLDYRVEKVPAFFHRDQAGYRLAVESTTAFITVRTDRQEELGCVGRYYHPLQNRDAFAVLQPLLDANVLTLETGGVLRGGADAWLLGRLAMDGMTPLVRDVFEDEILPYVLFANNHSGRRNATIAETPIRVVCANTLALAERTLDQGRGRAVAVRHTRGAEFRIVEAAEVLFAAVLERYTRLATDFQLLKRCRLTESEFGELVLDPVAPEPAPPTAGSRVSAAAFERASRRRAEIRRLWTEGEGHTGARTAWEAYNGLLQAIEHDWSFEPMRPGVSRVQSMLDGQLGRFSRQTFDRLLTHASSAVRPGQIRVEHPGF